MGSLNITKWVVQQNSKQNPAKVTFAVRLSIRLSVWLAGCIYASTPTLLMLESSNYMHDTPMHTDVGNIFEFFLRLQVLNNEVPTKLTI